jgi:hypothetical protein
MLGKILVEINVAYDEMDLLTATRIVNQEIRRIIRVAIPGTVRVISTEIQSSRNIEEDE